VSRSRAAEAMRRYRERHPERARETKRKWYARHREKEQKRNRERMRKRYAADPELHRQRSREWRKSNPEKAKRLSRNGTLKHRYGVTSEWYDTAFKKRDGKCDLCRRQMERAGTGVGRMQVLHVDHCHVARQVRGLLCPECNMGLGKLGDTVETLQRALNYLQEAAM